MEPPKKRPLSDDEGSLSPKRRVLSVPSGSPHINGLPIEQEELAEGDNLELFRKEAIFRRMKHYSREYERSQSRVVELEKRKHACEAGLATVAACWKELVKMINLLVDADEISEVTEDINDSTFDFQYEDSWGSEFAQTLEQKMDATRALVAKLIKGNKQSQAFFDDRSALSQCQRANTRCTTLQSQVDLMHARLKDLDEQKEGYHRALIVAESRLDRLRSKTVIAMQSRAAKNKEESGEDLPGELQRKPSSPADDKSPVLANGNHNSIELDLLREQVSSREARIFDLEREAAHVLEEKMKLEAEMRSISYERITESPYYKNLSDHAGLLQATLAECRSQISPLTRELNDLRSSRIEWEDGVISAASQANQELKSMLIKRDTENSRLREQREQQAAELNERRMQDSYKSTALRELEVLAGSRSERISVLESEVLRCKAQLAANAGHEELLAFFVDGNIEQAAFLKNGRDRLIAAEGRIAALEESLTRYEADYPDKVQDIRTEIEIRQRLAETEAALSKFKSLYGDPPVHSVDASMLVEQLRQKEEQIQRLRLLDVQRIQSETSLYTELDKLSAAWESLDRQVKDKVFDLSALEVQLKKALSEKAKSDNKYFAAMRDKDAIAAENQKLQRDHEKQIKAIERLVDAEKNLSAQLGLLEKELVPLRNSLDTYQKKTETLTEESTQLMNRLLGEKEKVYELSRAFQHGTKANAERGRELRGLQDELERARKLTQNQKLVAMDVMAEPNQGNDEEKQHLMSLLKCSTCKAEFRNTVITKCMHTFCRTCVDARISTRQRRCPACGGPFSQSDVLYGLYFQ